MQCYVLDLDTKMSLVPKHHNVSEATEEEEEEEEKVVDHPQRRPRRIQLSKAINGDDSHRMRNTSTDDLLMYIYKKKKHFE